MKFLLLIFVASVFVYPVARVSADQQLSSLGRYLPHISESPTTLIVASGICPQLRKTEKAPPRYVLKQNPLFATAKNIERGKLLIRRKQNLWLVKCVTVFEAMGMGVWHADWNLHRETLPAKIQ